MRRLALTISLVAVVAHFDDRLPVVGGERHATDPNSTERFLLLAPGGPVVVEATVFLDGKPFRSYQEGLVDAAMKQADADGDGQAAWDEAVANPLFLPGQTGADDDARKMTVKRYDRNRDGIVNRDEVRLLVAMTAGGPAFRILPRGAAASQPDVMGLLDADRDGTLSAEEIAAAPARLKGRDVNDDDLVELGELDVDSLASFKVKTKFGRVATGVRVGAVYALGGLMNPVQVNYGLKQRYGKNSKLTPDCFPLFPDLVSQVDRNKNGEFDTAELSELKTVAPHIAVTVHFGRKRFDAGEGESGAREQDAPRGLRLESVAPEFTSGGAGQTFAGQASLGVPGARMLFIAEGGGSDNDSAATVRSFFQRFDSDKNGYVEKKEIDGQETKEELLARFERYDANGDGKVFAEEIEADLERTLEPQRSRVTVSAGDRGTALFATLDRSGEGRLGLREMQNAAERLRTLDADNDGRLTADEIPREIAITFSRGSPNEPSALAGAADAAEAPPLSAVGPVWFQRMDRNGDGDVTLREFLGTKAQFLKLDADSDGFIDSSEAEAAGK